MKINLDNNRILPSNKSSTNNIPHITNNQSSDKYISRALSIEDNEDEVDESNTFKTKIDLFYNEGIKKKIFEFLTAFISFISFVIFIASTYDLTILEWFNQIDIGFCVFFNIEILLNFYLAQHRLLFFVDKGNIVNIVACTIPYLAFLQTQPSLKLLKQQDLLDY